MTRPRKFGMSRQELTEWILAQVDQIEGECWIWEKAGAPNGYGQVHFRGRTNQVHRFVYETIHGPLGELVVDHTCHNVDTTCPGGCSCPHRRCVNPEHLEAVSFAVNVARGRGGQKNASKTHCPQGHPYDEKNTYHKRQGGRDCITCLAASDARYRARKRAAA